MNLGFQLTKFICPFGWDLPTLFPVVKALVRAANKAGLLTMTRIENVYKGVPESFYAYNAIMQ